MTTHTNQITFLDRGQYVTGTTLQFYTLARRAARELLRDKLMTKLRIVAHIMGGLLFGLLYLDQGYDASHVHNVLGYIFFSLLFLMLATVMPTVLTFPVEKEVFIREHMNNWYRIKAYYYAKCVVDLPLQVGVGVCLSIRETECLQGKSLLFCVVLCCVVLCMCVALRCVVLCCVVLCCVCMLCNVCVVLRCVVSSIHLFVFYFLFADVHLPPSFPNSVYPPLALPDRNLLHVGPAQRRHTLLQALACARAAHASRSVLCRCHWRSCAHVGNGGVPGAHGCRALYSLLRVFCGAGPDQALFALAAIFILLPLQLCGHVCRTLQRPGAAVRQQRGWRLPAAQCVC